MTVYLQSYVQWLCKYSAGSTLLYCLQEFEGVSKPVKHCGILKNTNLIFLVCTLSYGLISFPLFMCTLCLDHKSKVKVASL